MAFINMVKEIVHLCGYKTDGNASGSMSVVTTLNLNLQ